MAITHPFPRSHDTEAVDPHASRIHFLGPRKWMPEPRIWGTWVGISTCEPFVRGAGRREVPPAGIPGSGGRTPDGPYRPATHVSPSKLVPCTQGLNSGDISQSSLLHRPEGLGIGEPPHRTYSPDSGSTAGRCSRFVGANHVWFAAPVSISLHRSSASDGWLHIRWPKLCEAVSQCGMEEVVIV